jgi:molybdate transport system substrate-binding protein
MLILSGAASKPANGRSGKNISGNVSISVDVVFGGSGFVLSQMKLARRGDVYFPGSSDFMEKAKRDGLVFPETERIVAYLIPAINVHKDDVDFFPIPFPKALRL